MKIVIPGNDDTNTAFADWVMTRIGRRAVKPYRALAAIEGGRIVGGVVFNGYNGANVDLTVYAPGGLSFSSMRQVFEYAFVDLRATRITARTKPGTRALCGETPVAELLQRAGFVRECLARRYYGSGPANDAIVYRMLRSECRWIERDKHGRRTRGARPQGDGRSAGADEPRNRGDADRPQRAKPVHPAREY